MLQILCGFELQNCRTAQILSTAYALLPSNIAAHRTEVTLILRSYHMII